MASLYTEAADRAKLALQAMNKIATFKPAPSGKVRASIKKAK